MMRIAFAAGVAALLLSTPGMSAEQADVAVTLIGEDGTGASIGTIAVSDGPEGFA